MKSPVLRIQCNQGIHGTMFCQYIFCLQVRTSLWQIFSFCCKRDLNDCTANIPFK